MNQKIMNMYTKVMNTNVNLGKLNFARINKPFGSCCITPFIIG